MHNYKPGNVYYVWLCRVWGVRNGDAHAMVQDELQHIEEASPSEGLGYSEEDGRIGANSCVMCNRGDGGLQCCTATGRVASTSNFGSALGTSGVIKGQWMYAPDYLRIQPNLVVTQECFPLWWEFAPPTLLLICAATLIIFRSHAGLIPPG